MKAQFRAFVARRPLEAVALTAAALIALALVLLLAARAASPGPGGPLLSQTVEPGPFASTIAVVGAVVPGDNLEIVAPLPGVVKQVGFEYGARVSRGQILMVIDDQDIRQRRDEARAAWLKAVQAAGEMADWPHGQEASRDRRAAEAAAYDLADTRRKVAETRMLLDRGLVARGEYEAILGQQHSQETALAAARQDLAATLARGRGADRQVANIELRDTAAQLAELEAEVGGAIVRSPADGVIVRPPSEKDSAATAIHVGQALTRGQLIGSIGRSGALAVSFQLSETDANAVRPGDAVTVTGPGFGGMSLPGRVVAVAGEASPGSANSGPQATFAATARIDALTPDQARMVRIGMTADVVISVYSVDRALVAPAAAIQGAAPDAFVMVRNGGGGRLRRVPIRIGHVNPDGVEVLSGLKPGDTVVWRASPAAQETPAPGS